jgi:hypothetical protein
MNLYKKKYLYANGSSVTAGGGFEPMQHRQDVRTLYIQKGINLPETQLECSYPFFVAEKLNLKVINDAKNGSGIDRLIRTSIDWIMNNEDKLEETIFLFEPQFGIRLDWYVREWGEYGVLNTHRNEKNEYPSTLVKSWYIDNWEEQNKWNEKYKPAIDGYLLNFFDEDKQYQLELKRLVMFVEFLNSRKMDYLISLPTHMDAKFLQQFEKIVPRKSNLFFKLKEYIDVPNPANHMQHVHFGNNLNVWQYAVYKNLLISDEIEHNDNHIGYEGNKIVADLVVDYIKYNNTIKFYAQKELRDLSREGFIKNLPIKFTTVDNLEDADFIYLADMNIFYFEELVRYPNNTTDFTEFTQKLDNALPWLRNLDKQNKRFLLTLIHERVNTSTLIKFFNFVEKEYGINRSQIWYVDSSVTEYPCTNFIPLEVKLKSFANLNKSDLFDNSNQFRNKKIISLNNKVSPNRLLVFDRILSEYGNPISLQNDNIISMRENITTEMFILLKSKLKSSYDNIQFPWNADTLSGVVRYDEVNVMYRNLIQLNSQCIFSIVNETERITFNDFNLVRDYEQIKDLQFSEKSLLPILGETFMFIITDGSFYRNMENIGFNFSYLKEIFDIDYLTNTLYENIEEVTKIVKFVNNKSIHELNAFRKNNYHYLQHNKTTLLDIMLGDSTIEELKFWERLSDKKIL